jgi:toxin ParE1/3/4
VKRAVRILRRAQIDLVEIQEYVSRDDPTAADRLIAALVSDLERLGGFPSRGSRPGDERLRKAGYRYLVHGEYLIFYKVLSTQVRVYRVLHGRRIYDSML